MSDLDDLSKDLAYAAGAGASRIASSVAASAKNAAALGFAPTQLPGPALASILARRSGHATVTTGLVRASDVPAIADRAAADAGRQGAKLLGGRR